MGFKHVSEVSLITFEDGQPKIEHRNMVSDAKCKKCGTDTRSHQYDDGTFMCHKCWLKYEQPKEPENPVDDNKCPTCGGLMVETEDHGEGPGYSGFNIFRFCPNCEGIKPNKAPNVPSRCVQPESLGPCEPNKCHYWDPIDGCTWEPTFNKPVESEQNGEGTSKPGQSNASMDMPKDGTGLDGGSNNSSPDNGQGH